MRYCRIRRPTLLQITLSALCLAAALQLVQATFGPSRGLRAEYYASDQPLEAPTVAEIEPNLSTVNIADAWRGAAPETFRARWYGYLTITRSGTYSFATTSDDGSVLSIDGERVVDNGGPHGPVSVTGTIRLDRGTHFVLVEFAQFGGPYYVSWSWAREGGRLEPVPGWVLTPGRERAWKVLGARGLDVSTVASIALSALFLLLLARQREWTPARHPRAAAFVLFLALSVVHTWPLASDPGHLTRHDNRDTLLNEWIIAWIAHQAPRAPWDLFHANIFYPEQNTLAYSEAMIVQAALGAPLLWLGASPVLTYGLLVLAGFTLTGWTMALVVQRWTGDWIAGLVAGLVFAFNAHTLTRLPHLQAQHAEFLPLVLLALDRVLSSPSVRSAMMLALWFVLQSLTSVYLLVFTLFATAAAAIARAQDWTGARLRPVGRRLALAGALVAAVLVPFLLPYWHASHDQGLTRGLADATQYSATWQDYLSTPSRFHYPWWSQRFFYGTALFPGALAIALSLLAIVRGVAVRDRRARMCLAIGLVGVVLSFGPKVPGYGLLYTVVPLLRGIRATARFGYLATLAAAVLAGYGVVVLRGLTAARFWPAVAAGLIAIASTEQLAAPIGFRRFDGIPRIYERLPRRAGTVVAELPFYGPRSAQQHAPYMLNSTAHWQPMINGYSGFQPASFFRHAGELADFPDDRSMTTLREIGVTHVFVHTAELSAPALALLAASRDLQHVDTFGTIRLYSLNR